MKYFKSLLVVIVALVFFGFTANSENASRYVNDDSVVVDTANVADSTENICPFCVETSEAWKIAGYVVLVIKVLVPGVLIVMLCLDLAKSAFSEKVETDKMISQIVKRILAAVLIFMIPTILKLTINLLDDINDVKSDYTNCTDCLLDPTGDACKSLSNKSC